LLIKYQNVFQGAAGQMKGVQPAFYANQGHPSYSHNLGQSLSPSAWSNNAGGYQGQPGAYNMGHHPESFQGFSAGAAMHGVQPPASWTVTSSQHGEMNRGMVGAAQPQWQAELQTGHQPGLSQPLFGSYSSPHHAEQSSREFNRRASNASLHQEGQPYQQLDNFSGHSSQSMVDPTRFQGYTASRSLSQQAATDPALQGFSPLQHAQNHYQQQHMMRPQSGPELPHWSGGQGQGSPQHHNPLVQIGSNQYLSQHQLGHGGPAGFPETAHVHQMPYVQSGNYSDQSPQEMGRAAGSQSVSEPWNPTPPSSGPL
jgi:hypothetical protein